MELSRQMRILIEFVTIATNGNGTDFGDLSKTGKSGVGNGTSNIQRGLFGGGISPGGQRMDFYNYNFCRKC